MGSKPSTLSIQFCSDLHLEFYSNYIDIPKDIILPSSPILALLGDIGLPFEIDENGVQVYEQFLLEQADNFEKVLVIAGNHEYYDRKHTMEEIEAEIKRICAIKGDKLLFLNNSSIIIDNVRILGSTLWTNIPEEEALMIMYRYNDYRLIYISKSLDETEKYYKYEPISTSDTNQLHKEAIAFIENEINLFKKNKERAIIVLSHYSPTFKNASNKDNLTTFADATNLEHLYCKNMYWLYGHTHFNYKQKIGGATLISNQRGYVGKQLVDNYKNNLTLKL